MTPERIAEMREKLAKATPGPWRVGSEDDGYGTVGGTEILFEDGCIGDTAASTCGEAEDAANAALIAIAPTALAEALDEIERLRDLLGKEAAALVIERHARRKAMRAMGARTGVIEEQF